ncbi:MAG: chemoreceptor glutamine deamidase CheD [Alphaproteobacteria bacterium]|nr:chemoreceptor glutamine deamidase CheD [Alphaproteobacteria bacterium]
MNARAIVASPGQSARRYLDQGTGLTMVQVQQGDCYVTNDPNEVLCTVLGSCVAACVRDEAIGWGGMNHFLLPEGANGANLCMRYGGFAMEQLINGILARGGKRERLEIKVFGGANVLANMWAVGDANALFIERFLANEGLALAASHLRGKLARKVQFFPVAGKVRMRELADRTEQAREHFVPEVRAVRMRASAAGSVELFD